MSLVLTIAVLASASDGAMVRCALAKTPKAEVTAMRSGIIAGVSGGAAPSAQTEALLRKLRDRAGECTPGTGRVDARAGEVAVAATVVESLSSALQTAGVDVLALNRLIIDAPRPALDALLAKQRNAETDALLGGAMKVGGDKAKQPRVRNLIGGYMFNAIRLGKLFASTAA
jgi:hypothetical protein